MPLTQISLREGKSPRYHKAIMAGVYRAMRETFDVPENDRFMTISEHDEAGFDYGTDYLDIRRSDELVIIRITANNTRTVEQKQALYAAIADNLGTDPGVGPGDIFINLVEVPKENWSFGNGVAQYAL